MRDVEVLVDGRWLPGALLDAYRRTDGRWRAVVTYSTEPGATYIEGRDQDEVRRASAR